MFVTRGHLPHQGACPRRATAVPASQRPAKQTEPRVRAVLAARADHDTAPAFTGAKYPQAEIAAEPEPQGFGAQPPLPWPYWQELNLSKMNTYAKRAANPRGMNTCKSLDLKVSCNEHLQKNGGRGGLIVTHGCGLYLQPTQTIVHPGAVDWEGCCFPCGAAIDTL